MNSNKQQNNRNAPEIHTYSSRTINDYSYKSNKTKLLCGYYEDNLNLDDFLSFYLEIKISFCRLFF